MPMENNKYIEIVKFVELMNPAMIEQFQRHDYRSMYEIWQMLRKELGLAHQLFEQINAVVPKEKYGVHASHCCKEHGCKYGNSNCPVELGLIEQEFPCEECQHED